jgi:hypothetical protein
MIIPNSKLNDSKLIWNILYSSPPKRDTQILWFSKAFRLIISKEEASRRGFQAKLLLSQEDTVNTL